MRRLLGAAGVGALVFAMPFVIVFGVGTALWLSFQLACWLFTTQHPDGGEMMFAMLLCIGAIGGLLAGVLYYREVPRE